MAVPNLLITGATGFIGFKVLLEALKTGYTVRVAVRSAPKGEALLAHPKVQDLGLPDKLSFVVVPDICSPGAYDEAIEGVSYVVHLASPLPSPFLDPQTGIYEPNVKSVSTMLQSALGAPSLKRLVITSSVFGNTPFPPHPTEEITAGSRVPDFPGPFDSMIPAYSAGKVAALNAVDRFLKNEQPKFVIIKVFPGFVFGADERALKLQDIMASTNRILLGIITGQTAPGPMPSGATHVEDAARVHIRGLEEDVVATDLGVTAPNQFDDAWAVVQKHFPQALADGIFTQGSQPTIPVNWNAHSTEVELGFAFKTYEDMVVDTARQYLELSKMKTA